MQIALHFEVQVVIFETDVPFFTIEQRYWTNSPEERHKEVLKVPAAYG